MSAARAEVLFDTGNVHDANGAWHDAALAFGACVMLAPDNESALINLGNVLTKAGRPGEAIEAYRRCLRIAPRNVNVMFNLGNALTSAGRLTEAVEIYVECLRSAPDFGAAYVNLAGVLRGLGVLDHAKTMAEAAHVLMPQNVDALACLAGLHFDLGEFDDAVGLYGQALAQQPGHAGVLSSLANALHSSGRLDAALALHDRAYAAAPDNADHRYNRALSMLAAGDYEHGWTEHEWRHRRTRSLHTEPDRGPAWNGGPIAGQTILLHAEQGLGDTLQFIRYAPMVAALGARVLVEVPAELVRLTRSVPGVAGVVAGGEPASSDTHCALMSLPAMFATTLDTVPTAIPYLTADTNSIATWRARLRADERPLVGLVWAGGSHHGDIDSHLTDRRRSLPDTALAPLGGIPGVHFVSLQRDARTLPERPDMTDPMPSITDFADTAALVTCLDLVIAVDTAVAHLAGALGKTVWLLSRYDGCWRWLNRQSDTPWYPTMRIFRQPSPGDWAGVMDQVMAELAGFFIRRA